jgi:hypothetical protein
VRNSNIESEKVVEAKRWEGKGNKCKNAVISVERLSSILYQV